MLSLNHVVFLVIKKRIGSLFGYVRLLIKKPGVDFVVNFNFGMLAENFIVLVFKCASGVCTRVNIEYS